MSALKEALKTSTSSKGSSSSKNPKFYNQQKGLFIQEMASSPNEATRVEVAGSEHVPAGTLKYMLESEADTDVLRIVLMNPRTPLKAISTFAADEERSIVFDDDDEVTEYLKARMNANSPATIDDEDNE